MLYKNLSALQTCFALLIYLLQQYVLSYKLDYCNPSKPNTFGAKLYLCFINYILSNPCLFIKQSFGFVFLNPIISYCCMWLLLINLNIAFDVLLKQRLLLK